jgi:hypothetical protein
MGEKEKETTARPAPQTKPGGGALAKGVRGTL